MAKRRLGVIISLEERRRRLSEENLRESNRLMIEAEHALFVALRLAGHRGPETPMVSVTGARTSAPIRQQTSAPVLPLRPRRTRAA
jgi:hypothetical protein